jgi:hypothetical protein
MNLEGGAASRKRVSSIVVYHSVSAKHLQGYLNEYVWRYNHRGEGEAQFEALLARAAAGR